MACGGHALSALRRGHSAGAAGSGRPFSDRGKLCQGNADGSLGGCVRGGAERAPRAAGLSALRRARTMGERPARRGGCGRTVSAADALARGGVDGRLSRGPRGHEPRRAVRGGTDDLAALRGHVRRRQSGSERSGGAAQRSAVEEQSELQPRPRRVLYGHRRAGRRTGAERFRQRPGEGCDTDRRRRADADHGAEAAGRFRMAAEVFSDAIFSQTQVHAALVLRRRAGQWADALRAASVHAALRAGLGKLAARCGSS